MFYLLCFIYIFFIDIFVSLLFIDIFISLSLIYIFHLYLFIDIFYLHIFIYISLSISSLIYIFLSLCFISLPQESIEKNNNITMFSLESVSLRQKRRRKRFNIGRAHVLRRPNLWVFSVLLCCADACCSILGCSGQCLVLLFSS